MPKHYTLFYRQKVMLALLQLFGGRLPNLDFQKYLFLFTEAYQSKRSYEFVPYHFGCFSFQSYADRRRLFGIGLIQDMFGSWKIVHGDTDYGAMLSASDRHSLYVFRDRYIKLRGQDLVKAIYRQYPYYAINSKIASKLLSASDLGAIESARPKDNARAFFTIGYEGQSFEHYLNRLIRHNVKLLCDVRKNPLSRKYGFSRSTLSRCVEKLGIAYVHIPELGIASEHRQDLKTQADYDRIFDNYEATTLKHHESSLDKLYNLLQAHRRIAITCFEAEPCMCHRSRVAQAMARRSDGHYQVIDI